MMQPPPAGAIDFNVLTQRIRRLMTLDTSVFEEVRTDRSETIPAIVVSAAAMLLFGLGGWLWWVLQDLPDSSDIFIKSFVFGSIASMVLWGISVAVTYVVLTQLFRARVDVNELVRVMGFAAAPLGLGVLMFIPAIEFGVALTAVALFFGATVIATQTATDAAPGRVLAACGAGFLVWAVVLGLLVGDSNTYAPGIFVFAPR